MSGRNRLAGRADIGTAAPEPVPMQAVFKMNLPAADLLFLTFGFAGATTASKNVCATGDQRMTL